MQQSTTYVYEKPTVPPQQSDHWKNLPHHEDNDEILLNNLDEVCDKFREFVFTDIISDDNAKRKGACGALWSCIFGYCEALTTHQKQEQRYDLYPIPYSALKRLVQNEFISPLSTNAQIPTDDTITHRQAIKNVSNWIWSSVTSKKNVKDEQHANSMYVCLRGKKVDGKSLDCFGAALCTVIGVSCLGYTSYLTLSEDHAYESHTSSSTSSSSDLEPSVLTTQLPASTNKNISCHKTAVFETCEVSVPGTTQHAKKQRGQEIQKTFDAKSNSTMTAASSWLYMANNPVRCTSVYMQLATAIANINCTIDMSGGCRKKSEHLGTARLYDFKRNFLWILYDAGHLSSNPYALIELGDCEEHRSSVRGDAVVAMVSYDNSDDKGNDSNSFESRTKTVDSEVPSLQCLKVEALYHEAVITCIKKYKDGQTYPYCYMGHYHKDSGVRNANMEYRLVEALRCYAQASRVASQYRYEWNDSLQLTKVVAALAKIIRNDVVCDDSGKGDVARLWQNESNCVAAGTWIMGFYDSLLFWEESTESQFLNILTPREKTGVAKLVGLFPLNIRRQIVTILTSDAPAESTTSMFKSYHIPIVSADKLSYFRSPRSKRMAATSLLMKAFVKAKPTIGEMELGLVVGDDNDSGRLSKRSRRSVTR